MKYKVICNGHTFEFSKEELAKEEILQTEGKDFHIISENHSYQAIHSSSDFANKKYTYKIKGKPYECLIQDNYDALTEKLGLNKIPTKEVNEIKSPMPGLTLDILIKEGQEVKEGESLLILEAMKMENVIKSPNDKRIKKIHINKGETVEKNQVLIEFE